METANDRRMAMNDLCDEIFNSRHPYTTCGPWPEPPPPTCRECDEPIEDPDPDDIYCSACLDLA